MANAFAMIDESIWRRDREFRALSRGAQCTFLQLLSQRDVDCAGVLTLHVDLLAKGCDELTIADIWRDLKELEAARFIYVDADTDELLIRTYLRRVSVKSPNALKSALKAARALASPKLRHALAVEMRRINKAEVTAVADAIDPGDIPSEPHPEPIQNPSERGNPSERDPEPPSYSSAVVPHSPPVDGSLGGTRARIRTSEAEPDPEPPVEEPPTRCKKHRHLPPDAYVEEDCTPCGNFRRAHDLWTDEQTAAAANAARQTRQDRIDAALEANELRQAATTHCNDCDDDGRRPNGLICAHTPGQADTNARGIAAVRAALTKTGTDDA